MPWISLENVRTVCALLTTLSFGSYFSVAAVNNPYDSDPNLHSVNVQILALSTAIHYSGGGQDTYVATILTKKNSPQLVKLIDSYSDYEQPIRRDILRANHPLLMTLSHDASGDTTANDIYLSGPTSRIFSASTAGLISSHDESQIQCFRVLHSKTRLSKLSHGHKSIQ